MMNFYLNSKLTMDFALSNSNCSQSQIISYCDKISKYILMIFCLWKISEFKDPCFPIFLTSLNLFQFFLNILWGWKCVCLSHRSMSSLVYCPKNTEAFSNVDISVLNFQVPVLKPPPSICISQKLNAYV